MNITEKREALKKHCIAVTGPEPKKSVLSEKGEKIKKILNEKSFGCAKESVAELVSAIIGEDLTFSTDRAKPDFSIVVPESNPNSHDYEIGKPVMVYRNRVCLRPDGTAGNDMCDSARKATKKEIESWFKAATDRAIEIACAKIVFVPTA